MLSHEGRSSSEFSLTHVEEQDSGKKQYPLPLEDYSQSAINRGQQYINYELTVVNQKIADALDAFKEAIEESTGSPHVELEGAISAVKKANEKVAGWYPPGCRSGGTTTSGTGGDDTGGGTGGDTGGNVTS